MDGVDFEVHPGEVLGIADESGCGKSVTLLSIMRMIAAPGVVEHISGPHLKRERIILMGMCPVRRTRRQAVGSIRAARLQRSIAHKRNLISARSALTIGSLVIWWSKL